MNPSTSRLSLTILMAASMLTSPQVLAQAAPFRGYYAIEQTLGQRLLQTGAPLDLSRYTSDQGLLFLLGHWDDSQVPRTFQNSQANALNILIYYVALSALASDIAATCQGPQPLAMNAAFAGALNGICSWPSAQAQSEKSLLAFWTALMGYDAPEDEYTAWRDFFLQSTYKDQPTNIAVRAMALSIMMNPYFLIND